MCEDVRCMEPHTPPEDAMSTNLYHAENAWITAAWCLKVGRDTFQIVGPALCFSEHVIPLWSFGLLSALGTSTATPAFKSTLSSRFASSEILKLSSAAKQIRDVEASQTAYLSYTSHFHLRMPTYTCMHPPQQVQALNLAYGVRRPKVKETGLSNHLWNCLVHVIPRKLNFYH